MGVYFFHDIHPFLRPWADSEQEMVVQKTYYETGPHTDNEGKSFYFHWTVSDLMNALIKSGLDVHKVEERPARDAAFWENGNWYFPPGQEGLQDWKVNPRAALPTWLQVAAQKI